MRRKKSPKDLPLYSKKAPPTIVLIHKETRQVHSFYGDLETLPDLLNRHLRLLEWEPGEVDLEILLLSSSRAGPPFIRIPAPADKDQLKEILNELYYDPDAENLQPDAVSV